MKLHYVESANYSPGQIQPMLVFISDVLLVHRQFFHLGYVYGAASCHNGGVEQWQKSPSAS